MRTEPNSTSTIIRERNRSPAVSGRQSSVTSITGRASMRKGWGRLSDLAVVILIALCVPLVILLLGLPVVLFVRLIVEIVHRL